MSSLEIPDRRLIGAALMAVALITAGCKGSATPFGPDGARLVLIPESLTLEVGLPYPFQARLGETLIASTLLSWSSGSPSIATVDASGYVTCIVPGEALITGVVDAPDREEDPRDSTLVTCIPPTLIVTDTESWVHTHVIGVSPCPDPVLDLGIQNPSDAEVTVVITSDVAALRSDRGTLVLAPGGSATVSLFFDCSRRSTFTALVTLRARDAQGNSQVETVEVQVEVVSP